jgi:hypothetical protein
MKKLADKALLPFYCQDSKHISCIAFDKLLIVMECLEQTFYKTISKDPYNYFFPKFMRRTEKVF